MSGKGRIGSIIDKLGNAGDKLFTSKHEKMQETNESLERNKEDRVNAREMYKSDASLQKWFALTFLVVFIIVIIGIVGAVTYFAAKEVDAPDWAISLFTLIFTAISMKIGTITDFLFGGSKTAEIQERRK